jgi:hypothetical protein
MKQRLIFIFLVLCLAALACNLPSSASKEDQPTSAFTFTPISVNTTEIPASPEPTATETPSPTMEIVSVTGTPTSTTTPCNMASFVQDVTIPDGKQITVNEAFTKTWKLKNVGSCTWTSSYTLVFDSGEQMGGPASQPMANANVAPGQTIDISVNLVAPNTQGTYRGNWKLKEPGGTLFGLSTGPFWVEIQAVPKNQPPAIPGWPTYQKGAQGPDVSAIQYLLNFHGQSLTPDGVFGNQTQVAVKSFQTQSGLAVDGIVGPQTWQALIQGAQVSQGSNSDAVSAAQLLLRDVYGYSLTVDGAYGPKTSNAVKNFQSNNSLSADGIVGTDTWKALITLQ